MTPDPFDIVLANLESQRERIDTAIAAIKAVRPRAGEPLHIESIEDAPPPPPPKRVIPTDPEELKGLALNLSNSGYGLGEIKIMLDLNAVQMQDFFATDV